MKRLPHLFALATLSLSGASAIAATSASSVQVSHGWVRWLPAHLPAAGYAVIRNDADRPMKLTGAESADYAMAMLHRSLQKNGKDTMAMVGALTIPAHREVKLAPGGYHLMLMNPKHAIKPGDTVHITLHFADGETVEATWPVKPANTSE